MTDNTEQKATRTALRDALEECERLTRHSYPAWLKAVDRLAALRSTITHPNHLTRAVDAYLSKAKP
jgi:hypothetical protein